MNAVFSSFFGSILIWLYPKYVSIKLGSSCPAVAFASWSIRGKGKLSLGHAQFRLVKSVHTLHFPLDFLTKQYYIHNPFGILNFLDRSSFYHLVYF